MLRSIPALLFLSTALLVGCQPGNAPGDRSSTATAKDSPDPALPEAAIQVKAPVPKERPEKKLIPLNTIYASTRMTDLMTIGAANSDLDRSTRVRIRKAATSIGLPSAFLVRARNESEFLRATGSVLGSSWNAGKVAPAYRRGDSDYDRVADEAGDIWVCAYLGTKGSSPSEFDLASVELEGGVVRVAFKKVRTALHSNDVCAYIIWANLGRIPNGTYQVELVDATEEPTFVATSRRVVVAPPEK